MSYIQINDDSLNQQYIEDIIGDYISGLTGLDRNSIRPAHQPIHPILKQNETICVFNIHRSETKGFWAGVNNNLYSERTELYIHIFFYGLNGFECVNKLIKGSFIQQNSYELANKNMSVMKFTDIYEMPVNINGIEILRHDVTMKVSLARNISYNGTYFNNNPQINVNGG